MLDTFFEKNDIEMKLEFYYEEKLEETEEVKKIGKNHYQICFLHSKKDGVQCILDLLKYRIGDDDTNCCCSFFTPSSFFFHYYRLQKNPFFTYFNERLYYDYFAYTIKKNLLRKKSVYFAALLCYTFFRQTRSVPFCKLQIINYLPKIPEKNKLFPDVMIVPLSPKSTLDSIYHYILRKQKTKEQLWEIYSKYSFMSKLYTPENIQDYISYFDVTLSYIPYHLPISNLVVISKSRQFEKIYLLITRNISDFYFSFVMEDRFKDFAKKFYQELILK